MAIFYFKALFGAVTIRGWLDITEIDKHVTLTISIAAHLNSTLYVCAYVYSGRPFTMRKNFEDGVYLG